MRIKPGYFIREAITNLRRNKLMTFAATVTAAVSLLLLGGVMTLDAVVRSFTSGVLDEVEVSVFLVDDITPAQQDAIGTTLEELVVVRGLEYVPKDEALEEWRAMYRDQPAMLENVTADVLPASFRVKLIDPSRVDVIKSTFERDPTVDEVVDHRDLVQKLVSFTRSLRMGSVVMVAILLGAAVLLIANTTQLAIYARRREIEIMKLVGATNWFVRLPFMVEGIVAGVAGALISLAMVAGVKELVRSQVPPFIPTTALHGVAAGQFLVLITLGVVVGALGSAVAVRRFLEV
jgi:cell division transport system permease protein